MLSGKQTQRFLGLKIDIFNIKGIKYFEYIKGETECPWNMHSFHIEVIQNIQGIFYPCIL